MNKLLYRMRRIPVLSRYSVRLKFGLLFVTVFLVHFLRDGLSMVDIKLKHPKQYIVKMTAWPTFVEEVPDGLDDKPETNTLSNTLCPKKPPHLIGYQPIDENQSDMESVTQKYIPHRLGGHFKPKECVSRTKTAVIIAYRNRERHLVVLLNHLIPFLVRQQAEFAIFVVEPVGNITFNRALLMNVGFMEALKTNDFNCFIFHDVDLVPESDYNMYRCGNTPRHMAVATSHFEYSLQFHDYAGGVVAMSRDIYKDINGHSNLYFGWGGEDDDLLYRLAWKGYKMSRYPDTVARYTAIFHKRDTGNEISGLRFKLLWTTEKRLKTDGLNSLRYKVVNIETLQLYTKILVGIDMNYYNKAIIEFT